MKMSQEQMDILNCNGNVVVKASAGTGKTEILVRKIEDDLIKKHTHKVIGAITFTIKATNELRKRIKADTSNCFIGTNNRFAIKEIIEPFIKNVYGKEYEGILSTDYTTKMADFKKCMKYLEINKRICSYTDSEKNFVFDLALLIVKKSTSCRKYLQAKYFKIFIDEYQDCDISMHKLFMYLCMELNIELFIVGDEKQSIYMWRGAYPKAFSDIFRMENFNSMVLRANYRSCQQIQNYSNLLNEDTQYLYKYIKNDDSILLIKAEGRKWVDKIKDYLDLKKTCALLRYKNADAKICAEELSSIYADFTYVPKTPLSEVVCDASWLYNGLAKSLMVDKYSYYDFLEDIPLDVSGSKETKRLIHDKLDIIKKCFKEKDQEEISKNVKEMVAQLGYTADDAHIKKLIETIMDEQYRATYLINKLKHVSMTFHSSKGLEYEQVIVFANDYSLSDSKSIYNHYVAVTRGKNKLFIILNCDYNARYDNRYWSNLCKIFKKAGVNPEDVMTIK